MRTFGLEIDGDWVYTAQASKSNKDQFDLDQVPINSLISHFKNSSYAMALPSEYTLIKSCLIPAKNSYEAKKALPFQLEQMTFLNPQECIQQNQITKKDDQGYHFRLLLTPKEQFVSYLEKLNKIQLDPDFITPENLAIQAFSQKFCLEQTNLNILYLGKTKTICMKIEEGILKMSITLPQGVDKLRQALILDLPDLEDQIDDQMKKILLDGASNYHHFYLTLQEWKKSLERAFFSFHVNVENKSSKEKYPLFITGSYHAFFNIPSYLENQELFSKILISTKPHYDLHAIAIGSLLSLKQKKINLRQKEFASIAYKRKYIAYTLSFLTVCLLTSVALFINGSHQINKKQKALEMALHVACASDPYLKEKKLNLTGPLENQISLVKKNILVNAQNPFLKSAPLTLSEFLFHLTDLVPLKDLQTLSYEFLDKKSQVLLTVNLTSSEQAKILKDLIIKKWKAPFTCSVEQKNSLLEIKINKENIK